MSYMTFTVNMFIYCEFNLPTQKISKKHNTRERSKVAISVGFVLVKEFTSAFQADKTVVFLDFFPVTTKSTSTQIKNAVSQDLRKGFSETLPSSCELIIEINDMVNCSAQPRTATSLGVGWTNMKRHLLDWRGIASTPLQPRGLFFFKRCGIHEKKKNTSYTNHAPGCV